MNAPVMMHSLDEGGRLLRVNRRWAQELGYEPRDVLGRAGIDFLTEPSRAWAIRDTLPLFWKALRARSVGYEFFRADGRRPRGASGRGCPPRSRRQYAFLRRNPQAPRHRPVRTGTHRAFTNLRTQPDESASRCFSTPVRGRPRTASPRGLRAIVSPSGPKQVRSGKRWGRRWNWRETSPPVCVDC